MAARLVDHIKIPMARASILWLIGEYCDRVPKIAPDVLRKMARTFINEVRRADPDQRGEMGRPLPAR